MLGRSHVIGAAAVGVAAAAITGHAPAEAVAVGVAATVTAKLPDVDRIVNSGPNHRSITHSVLLAGGLVVALAFFASQGAGALASAAFLAALPVYSPVVEEPGPEESAAWMDGYRDGREAEPYDAGYTDPDQAIAFEREEYHLQPHGRAVPGQRKGTEAQRAAVRAHQGCGCHPVRHRDGRHLPVARATGGRPYSERGADPPASPPVPGATPRRPASPTGVSAPWPATKLGGDKPALGGLVRMSGLPPTLSRDSLVR